MEVVNTPKPVAVKLDGPTRERIKRLADARQRSSHWVMREAIEQYVEREEKRETYRQAGISAWESYQSTGLHATADEADAWLRRLENGEEAPPPECHG